MFLELGEEPGCADVVCLGYFFSCDEGGISFGKFVRCAVYRGFDIVSYLIEFVLSDSDCTGSEALERDVVLFDEGVDGVTAYLKQFGCFCEAEEVLFKQVLESCFFCETNSFPQC